MKIKYVTITGADNNVDPEDLQRMSARYPFVEWGILFSQSKADVPRYPGLQWVEDLSNNACACEMNLSAHLCGKWVQDEMEGLGTFEFDYGAFSRMQLNMGKDRLQSAFASKPLRYALEFYTRMNRPTILGGDYAHVVIEGDFFKDLEVYPLFDASGGRGKTTKNWPLPLKNSDNGAKIFCGYAGGIGPDNIETILVHLEDEVVKDGLIWIDMESRVRDESNQLCFEKVEECLKVASRWVG